LGGDDPTAQEVDDYETATGTTVDLGGPLITEDQGDSGGLIVSRQLQEAIDAETDPVMKARLESELKRYRDGLGTNETITTTTTTDQTSVEQTSGEGEGEGEGEGGDGWKIIWDPTNRDDGDDSTPIIPTTTVLEDPERTDPTPVVGGGGDGDEGDDSTSVIPTTTVLEDPESVDPTVAGGGGGGGDGDEGDDSTPIIPTTTVLEGPERTDPTVGSGGGGSGGGGGGSGGDDYVIISGAGSVLEGPERTGPTVGGGGGGGIDPIVDPPSIILPTTFEQPEAPFSIRGYFGFAKNNVEDQYRRNPWTYQRGGL
jgi:hypothetical protein